MERIGKLPRALFGELPIAASAPGYRLRNRFHVAPSDGTVRIGLFAPRTHRVESVAACEAISRPTLDALPRIAEAIETSSVAVREITTVEDLDGSRRLASLSVESAAGADVGRLERDLEPIFAGCRITGPGGVPLADSGARRLSVRVASRELLVQPDAFFQSNRFLVRALFEAIRDAAGSLEPAPALDAYGGVGLFAGALLDAGHDPVTAEEGGAAVECAKEARRRWDAEDRWEIVRSTVEHFLASSQRRFGVIVADPPRGGVGRQVARALAARTSGRILLVSCDAATLARDLPEFLAGGWRIRATKLYDLFAFTHRVEALVTLEPVEA
jgi:tRNA/tmRNA/rRNA uracil-C5-methylase (TrmA/RlmC/RlmD family)